MRRQLIFTASLTLVFAHISAAAPVNAVRTVVRVIEKVDQTVRVSPQVRVGPQHIFTIEPSTKVWTATPRRQFLSDAVRQQLAQGQAVHLQPIVVDPEWLKEYRKPDPSVR